MMSKLSVFVCTGIVVTVIASANVPAMSGEKMLHKFHGGRDGMNPDGALIADASGNLYGTTSEGGGGTGCQNGVDGCGTVFKLGHNGGERVLYAFAGGNDGAYPASTLIADSKGDLYGTTTAGGGTGCGGGGCGTVFEVAADGTETVLYAFQGGSDGSDPLSGLISDADGNFYGTTAEGGDYAGGTVFELLASGQKNLLYAFQGGSDGLRPEGTLMADSSSNLYGTTVNGGGGCGGEGCGTVFKLDPKGTETVLHAFQGGTDGAYPFAVALIADHKRNLYGTTSSGGGGADCPGGAASGCGTVFKIAPNDKETLLYAFQGGSNGLYPIVGLIMDKAGNLYGTTQFGGRPDCTPDGCGTVFKLAPGGAETVLYDNVGATRYPDAALLMGKNGVLYGTSGGGKGDGAVFSVTTKSRILSTLQSGRPDLRE